VICDIYKIRANVDVSKGFNEAFENVCGVIREFVKKNTGIELGNLNYDDNGVRHVVLPKRCIQAFSFNVGTEQFNISLTKSADDGLLFGLRVSGEAIEEHPERRLIAQLFRQCSFIQDVPVVPGVWRCNSPASADTLYDYLVSPERTLPIIVTSECNRLYPPVPGVRNGIIVQPEAIAGKVTGAAVVAHLDYQTAYQWTEKVGKEWSCFGGACRVYMPGLSFEEDELLSHPLYLPEKIWWWRDDEGRNGAEAFSGWLVGKQWHQNSYARISWKGLYFANEALALQEELEADRSRERSEISDTLVMQHTMVHRMQQMAHKAEAERDEWFEEGDKLLKDIEHYKNLCIQLRNQNDQLRAQLARKDAGNEFIAPPVPDSYAGLGDWVRKYLAGRLVLTGRAEREAKDAVYEDVKLVYRSLLLLAFDYRNTRLGLGNDVEFKAKLDADGLNCTGSIDPARAGQEGDSYYVNYPAGSTKRAFLKFHLTKGTGHDKRRCMRIYFFWDDEAEVVVVGSLPAHLDNRMT